MIRKLLVPLVAGLAFTLSACDQSASKPDASPPETKAKPAEAAKTAPTAAVRPAAPPQPEAAPGGVDATKAETLPEAPKLDPKNEHKALNPDKTLFVELAPDPKDAGKKKPVRVLLVAEVCLRQGPLEVLLCKTRTKEHEAILRADVDARFIHSALVFAGAKPGSPVQFVNQTTGEAEYKPATGTRIAVKLDYHLAGKRHSHPAQEWILDARTKKPMAHHWVFAGSRFMKNPDRPNDPDYYTANNGEIIAISNFVDSMLDLPVEVSRDNIDLSFGANTDRIPPLLSKVWVILEPQPVN